MGFGILFLGYLISINNIAYPGFTKILAYLVMLLAMVRLGQYNRHLKAAYNTLIPTAIVGTLYMLLEAASVFSLLPKDAETLLFRIIPLAIAIFELIFLSFLLKGLFDLAVETRVKTLEIASFRNRLFTGAYYFLYIFGQLDYGADATRFLIYYNLAILLVGFVIMLMNAKLFYNFYMWICLPEDLEMKKKPATSFLSKIGNRIASATDKQWEKRIEQDKEYREQKHQRKDTQKRK